MNRTLRLLFVALFFAPLSSFSQEATDSLTAAKRDTLRRTSCPIQVITAPKPWLKDQPVSVFTRCLDGAIPGLQSTNGGGQPGSSPELLIRGINSLFANSAPLLVVNGAVYSGSISSINPRDIYSITVLKDAISTITYGNRSANGVLEIVTKKKMTG